MSTSTTLARTKLRLRDHLLKCSSLMCLRKMDISKKNKEHSGSGHAQASPSGSVHKTPLTSGSFYFILLREFALFQFREYGFTHRANVVNRHSREVQPRSVRATQNRARTSCATLALCSAPWDGPAPMACSSQVSLKFMHEHVTFIKFLQSVNVVSKLLCPWSDVKGSVSPHAAGLGTCPPTLAQTSLLTLAGGKSCRSAIFFASSPTHRSIRHHVTVFFFLTEQCESVRMKA